MIRTFRMIAVILTGLLSLSLGLFGCSPSPKGEGFAIYLTKSDIPPTQMPAMSHVEIEDQPVISLADIVSYNAQTCEMELSQDAFERLSRLDVPIRGKSFMVCVDKGPIYFGAFWTPISSMSFDGVTIWKPMSTKGPAVISLQLGYPSESFYGGEDPRNDPEIIASLRQSGKLIEKLSLEDINTLPGSFKGYELYSWSENEEWHFTLITGTNRNKTPEEIVSEDNYISKTGWIKISVSGTENIKNVLSKLPSGEFVSWLGGRVLTNTGDFDIVIPPESVVGPIRDYARECGLDFSVV